MSQHGQAPNNQYEMHTLHSPTTSPQQPQGHFQSMDPGYSPNSHIAASFPPPPVTQPAGYTHQQIHPALHPLPSPGLPPPGTEPPYTSQPNSPTFPPPQFQHKGDMHYQQPAVGTPGASGAGAPPHVQTSFPPPPQPTFDPSASQVPKTPLYTPGSMVGPNGAGVHAPGQIAHPNQQQVGLSNGEKYKHSAWNCFSDFGICCTGCWCPCILYSRTKHRIKTIPNSNLNAFSSCNPHCMVFCVLAPCSWVFTLLQRTRIRENYRLEGSVAGDCARAYCCSCCTLIQDEKEVRDREDERRRFAGPGGGAVGGEGYKKNDAMKYGM